MKGKLSTRVTRVEPSATCVVDERARAMARRGLDVINLGGGDPDFATPRHIVGAAVEAMENGYTHYVSSRGLSELRKAIARKLRRENELDFDPDTEIIVTAGAKLGLYAAIMAAVGPGDEVLILDPFWVSYEPCVQLANGIPVRVPLSKAGGFQVTVAGLRDKITARTKLLMINSPNNPTGRVLNDAELKAVAEVAKDSDLLVLSDEIYEKIVYDGHRHISIGSLPGMLERTIVVNGFSKAYAMTGWRLGYVAAKEPLTSQFLKVQQHSVTCATSFVQYGGIAALNGSQAALDDMVTEYAERRDIVVEGLNALPGISCVPPEGGFYAFPEISETGLSSVDFSEMLLDEALVAVTPGAAFGACGEGHVRISFATSPHLVRKALKRMRDVLA